MGWLFAIAVKTFVLFAYALVVGFCVVAVKKWFPAGRLKDLLLSDPIETARISVARQREKASSKS